MSLICSNEKKKQKHDSMRDLVNIDVYYYTFFINPSRQSDMYELPFLLCLLLKKRHFLNAEDKRQKQQKAASGKLVSNNRLWSVTASHAESSWSNLDDWTRARWTELWFKQRPPFSSGPEFGCWVCTRVRILIWLTNKSYLIVSRMP